ncbi:MAG TPA: mechanosensitive ion channel family protein, partial [Methanophagales archaeon]|nr:mechanosensitive ion channel family protein [Methanophagales archaeon]
MLHLNMTDVPAETVYNLIYTVIKISGAIVATVIVAQFIDHALRAYFKFATGKLKVDETTYTVVRRIIILTIYVIGAIVVIALIPGLPDMMLGLAAGAGIAAIIIGFAAQRALSNIFSGISIAIFRPFRVGDVVEMEEGVTFLVDNNKGGHFQIAIPNIPAVGASATLSLEAPEDETMV